MSSVTQRTKNKRLKKKSQQSNDPKEGLLYVLHGNGQISTFSGQYTHQDQLNPPSLKWLTKNDAKVLAQVWAFVEEHGLWEHYAAVKESHNSCARSNLDNSNGFLACYVLPQFKVDGTHEPWGDKDVPWGRDIG